MEMLFLAEFFIILVAVNVHTFKLDIFIQVSDMMMSLKHFGHINYLQTKDVILYSPSMPHACWLTSI